MTVPFKERPLRYRLKVYSYEWGRKAKFLARRFDVEIFCICVAVPVYICLECCT